MSAVLHPKPSLRLEPRGAFEATSFEDVEWEPIDQEFWVDADSAERLVRRFLVFCESPRTQATAMAMVRGSVAGGRTGRRVYAFVNRLVVHPILQAAGIKASALRMELVASQLIGMAMMRYVLEVEPMASATADEIVELMAPSVRAALENKGPNRRSRGGRRRTPAPQPLVAAAAREEPVIAPAGASPKHRSPDPVYDSWLDDFDATMVIRD